MNEPNEQNKSLITAQGGETSPAAHGEETKRPAEQQAIAQKPRMSKRRKKRIRNTAIAVVLIAGVAAAIIVPRILAGRDKDQVMLDLLDTTVLSRTEIRSVISADGVIESAESTKVYSTLANNVSEVNVELGDYVREGQVLAQLDAQSILDQIASQEINMDMSSRVSAGQVESAESNYSNFKYGLDHGTNSALLSAQERVDGALAAYENAKLAYERYVAGTEAGENGTVLSADSALRNAETALDNAETALDNAREEYDDAVLELRKLRAELVDLEEEEHDLKTYLENAQVNLNSLNYSMSSQLAELQAESADLESRIKAYYENMYSAIKDPSLGIDPDSNKAEIEKLEARLAEIRSRMAMVSATSSANVQSEVAESQADLAEVTQDIAVHENSIEALEDSLDMLKKQIEQCETALENAEKNYESQKLSHSASMTSVDNALEDYAENVSDAWDAYEDALASQKAAEKAAEDQLEAYAHNLSNARTGADTSAAEESLRQLRATLEKATIKAPCDGTVTAVYASVGTSGAGLLFVIEDVDDLVVETSVDWYDVGAVKPGLDVVISSDATGDAQFDGVLSTVAPTASKNAAGVTDTVTDPVFEAEVAITSKDTGLRIGMEAQVDYVLAREADVLAVPYDAVYENAQGESCVIAAYEQEDGTYLLREMRVATGVDDDVDIAISGEGIAEGLRILNEPEGFMAFLGQSVSAGVGVSSNEYSTMFDMMNDMMNERGGAR